MHFFFLFFPLTLGLELTSYMKQIIVVPAAYLKLPSRKNNNYEYSFCYGFTLSGS